MDMPSRAILRSIPFFIYLPFAPINGAHSDCIVHHILQGFDMVIRDQDNVVLIPHLIEALDNKWDEVVRHTRKWLLKDDEEILLSGSALGDQFKEQYRDLQQRGCIFLG